MAKGKRGFASMAPDKRSEIARKGGQATHVKGTAHEYTPQEVRIAGSKGGKKVSQDRVYMALIGRRGGVKRRFRCGPVAGRPIASPLTYESLP